MSGKVIAIIAIIVVAGLAFYFLSRKKGITDTSAGGVPDYDIAGQTGDPANLNAAQQIVADQINNPKAEGSGSIINAANAAALAKIANQASEALTGKTAEEHGIDLLKKVLNVASDNPEKVTAALVAAATPEALALASGGAAQAGASAAIAAAESAGVSAAAGAPPLAVVGGAEAATGGLSGLATAAIGIAPIVLILAIAWKMGVFDETDWKDPMKDWHPITLNKTGAALAGMKEGDTLKIPKSVYEQMLAKPDIAETILNSYLATQRKSIEDKATASVAQQKQWALEDAATSGQKAVNTTSQKAAAAAAERVAAEQALAATRAANLAAGQLAAKQAANAAAAKAAADKAAAGATSANELAIAQAAQKAAVIAAQQAEAAQVAAAAKAAVDLAAAQAAQKAAADAAAKAAADKAAAAKIVADAEAKAAAAAAAKKKAATGGVVKN